MKKTLIAAVAGFALLSLTSCQDEYYCTCYDADGVETFVETITNNKVVALAECEVLNLEEELEGGYCELD